MNRWRSFLITHHSSLITVLLVLICFAAAVRIAASYRVFSQTYDEGAHVGAGLEWLSGTYEKEQQHPPLQRIAVAIGPYLAGARFNPRVDLSMNGIDAFHLNNRYSTMLSFARAGTLPFLIGSILVVFFWSKALFGREVALISAAIYSMLQPVLAHGALATTDMSLTATVPAALFAMDRFVRKPSLIRGGLTGAAIAGALVSKLSSLLFLIAGAVAVLLCWLLDRRRKGIEPVRGGDLLRGVLVMIGCAFLTLWAVYRFTIGPVLPPNMQWKFNGLASSPSQLETIHRLGNIPIPAPQFVGGIGELLAHNKMGHWSYLLGERKEGGWWYYFPIAFALKTPIPFLMLMAIGIAVVARLSHSTAPLVPVFAATGILLTSLPSKINIGIRHVLPMYPLLAIVSGAAIAWLWRRVRFRDLFRASAAVLAFWLVVGSAAAHPDYLPWFNEFAGDRPQYFLLDSNLDWGQDFLRLKREVHARRLDSLMLSYFGTAIPERHNFPPLRQVDFGNPRPGWFAVSEQHVYAFPWLQYFQPVVKPGPSIRLYYIPEVTD